MIPAGFQTAKFSVIQIIKSLYTVFKVLSDFLVVEIYFFCGLQETTYTGLNLQNKIGNGFFNPFFELLVFFYIRVLRKKRKDLRCEFLGDVKNFCFCGSSIFIQGGDDVLKNVFTILIDQFQKVMICLFSSEKSKSSLAVSADRL